MSDDYIDKFRNMVIEKTVGAKQPTVGALADSSTPEGMLEQVMRNREQDVVSEDKERDELSKKVITEGSVNMVKNLMGFLR